MTIDLLMAFGFAFSFAYILVYHRLKEGVRLWLFILSCVGGVGLMSLLYSFLILVMRFFDEKLFPKLFESGAADWMLPFLDLVIYITNDPGIVQIIIYFGGLICFPSVIFKQYPTVFLGK